jgi:large subunit ribosomal protein L9
MIGGRPAGIVGSVPHAPGAMRFALRGLHRSRRLAATHRGPIFKQREEDVKIILREDVRDLGHSGELVEVKEGYARNYLLPRKLAVPATPGNLKDFNKRIQVAREREAKERAAATALGDRLRGQRIVLIQRVAEGTTRLHGSVTAQDVAQALTTLAGQEIDRRDVDLRQPIRSLGEYNVNVKMMRGLSVPVKVLVADREPVEEVAEEPEATETEAAAETPEEATA